MECEICGKPISNNPIKAKIEESIMVVCEDCAKLGKIQKKAPKPKFQSKNKKQIKKQHNTKKNEPSEELIENYSEVIRNKREKNNWSREELASKVFEKTSVISRIESEKMVPDTKLTKKLEKILNVTLIETIDSTDLNQFINYSSDGFTLADVVKIKKK